MRRAPRTSHANRDRPRRAPRPRRRSTLPVIFARVLAVYAGLGRDVGSAPVPGPMIRRLRGAWDRLRSTPKRGSRSGSLRRSPLAQADHLRHGAASPVCRSRPCGRRVPRHPAKRPVSSVCTRTDGASRDPSGRSIMRKPRVDSLGSEHHATSRTHRQTISSRLHGSGALATAVEDVRAGVHRERVDRVDAALLASERRRYLHGPGGRTRRTQDCKRRRCGGGSSGRRCRRAGGRRVEGERPRHSLGR